MDNTLAKVDNQRNGPIRVSINYVMFESSLTVRRYDLGIPAIA